MTEAQRAQTAEPAEQDESEPLEPLRPAHSVEVGDRAWTMVDLPDGKSWDLYRNGGSTGELGILLAHIVVTDEGYLSTDHRGTVRGPYVTLDEAAYPLGLDDPLLLDDGDVVVQPAPASTPAPAEAHTPVPTEAHTPVPTEAAPAPAAPEAQVPAPAPALSSAVSVRKPTAGPVLALLGLVALAGAAIGLGVGSRRRPRQSGWTRTR